MSFFDWIVGKVKDVVDDAVLEVRIAFDWVKDKLLEKKFDEDNVADHVDVDAVLAEFRDSIRGDVDKVEKRCMESVSTLFSDLIDKTKDKFPDLIEIIKNEQQEAEKELKGTIMKYIKEYLSKNDPSFLNVLKMSPGAAKEEALDISTKKVLEEAELEFNSKLKTYVEHILEEFTTRLKSRISTQEDQMNKRIDELEKLQEEAENGKIDIEALRDFCAPIMESAECILHLLRTEM